LNSLVVPSCAGIVTPTTCESNAPTSIAAAASSWDRAAYSSSCWRDNPQRTVPLADGGPDRPDDYRFTRHAENLSAS
jgi:hypothetical protein